MNGLKRNSSQIGANNRPLGEEELVLPNDDLKKLTDLVQDLTNKLSFKRETREQIDLLTSQVLEEDQRREQLILDHADPTIKENLLRELKEVFEEEDKEEADIEQKSFIPELTLRNLMKENVDLKMELQRLEAVEDQSTQLVSQFEKTLFHLRNSIVGYNYEYESTNTKLEESYQLRLQEELDNYQNLELNHERLKYSLSGLNDSLKKASNLFQLQIDSFQNDNK